MKLRNIVLLLAVVSLVFSTTSFAQENAKSTETAAPANHSSNLKIVKGVLCQAVKDREPQEEVSTAKVGDVVIGWMQIQSTEDTTVTHRWMLDGQTISDVSLNVKTSPSFRAWSRKTIGSAGNWKWQILDSSGNVLKEVTFTAGS
jgi:Protein of unknown function (DUF2914)